ncbi:MAG TPA: aminotransferase class IV [Candidatus Nanopelagicales bacterium]|nr:aminotransferase class IV [Candidatus Nanopelagicales bacterium]
MSDTEAADPGARPIAWVDGRLLAADTPALLVGDRGFQLGDGLFETLRVRRGVAIEIELHLARLREGLGSLAIPMPLSDGELAAGIAAVVAANAPADAAVRVTVSRGAPVGRGLLPAGWPNLAPTVVIQAWPHVPVAAEALARGVRAVIATGRRDPAFPLASVKTTSRADHVHAKLEAERVGADDAITLTLDGHVAEATTANVAMLVGKRMLTPPLAAGILAGTTRDWLLRAEGAAALGLAAAEAWITPGDLLAADEVLLCSSVAGFQPVVTLDGTPIAGGAPGPWSARLRAAREAWIVEQSGG